MFAYPAFEEMFLETYSLLTMDDRAVLDTDLVSIRQLRGQKAVSAQPFAEKDETNKALDKRIDAMEERLYVRIRQAMARM